MEITDDLTWLNTFFVERVLQEVQNDNSIRVFDVIVKPATAKGDNYLSNMQRIVIKFSRDHKGSRMTKTLSLIAKILPQNDIIKELITSTGLFETEMSMMLETLPKINRILSKLNASSLSPRCLYVQNEDPVHLVMEDLALEGFRMVINDQRVLDLNHCLFIIRKLADFHAGSILLEEKDPTAVRLYKKSLFSGEEDDPAGMFFNGGTRALAEEAMKWPELDIRIADKVLRLSENIFEKGCEAVRFRDDDFNVLNHGDFWINNMMFRYDEQQNPIDMKFVDFQFSYYGSPAVDILYFMGIITTEDVRMNHRDSLLREYHESLTGVMEKLGCVTKAPRLEDLQGIMEERIIVEMISSFVALPLILVERSEMKSMTEIRGINGKNVNNGYQSDLFRKKMTNILLSYDGMGLLDS